MQKDKTATIKIGTKTYKCWYEYKVIHFSPFSEWTNLRISGTKIGLHDICEYAKLMEPLDDNERQNHKINIETEQLIFNGCWLRTVDSNGWYRYLNFSFDYMEKKKIPPKEIKNKIKQLFGFKK